MQGFFKKKFNSTMIIIRIALGVKGDFNLFFPCLSPEKKRSSLEFAFRRGGAESFRIPAGGKGMPFPIHGLP